VFILKVVKVFCFDTLLQVFILKEMYDRLRINRRRSKPSDEGTPPQVFWRKRPAKRPAGKLQAIENKQRELRKERQENSRGGKLLKG
jgi:hypothetical protein